MIIDNVMQYLSCFVLPGSSGRCAKLCFKRDGAEQHIDSDDKWYR